MLALTAPVRPSLALVIPTCNRAEELSRCIASLEVESRKPGFVIVADSSDGQDTLSVVQEWSRRSLGAYEHVRCPVRGLTAQRNYAIARIPPDTDYVGFTDDDIVFDADYHRRLLELLENRSGLVGVAGATAIEDGGPAESWLRRRVRCAFMLTATSDRGQLLASGINIRPPDQGPPLEVDWLFGCAVYRAEALRKILFAEELPGYAQYEDVDYSIRMRRFGRLMVDPEARVVHAHSPGGRLSTRDLARVTLRNRHWLVRTHRDAGLRLPWFWWSTFGLLLLASASAGLRRQRDARDLLMGVLAGIRDVLGTYSGRVQ
jgi:GT2 family glycosyltransferase